MLPRSPVVLFRGPSGRDARACSLLLHGISAAPNSHQYHACADRSLHTHAWQALKRCKSALTCLLAPPLQETRKPSCLASPEAEEHA